MEPALAIGLMSGTSRDGIDAALIRSDGEAVVEPLAFLHRAYDPAFRALLADACALALDMPAPAPSPRIDIVARQMTIAHAELVRALLDKACMSAANIAAIGFHGHTVAHRPERRWTWQIGDAALLARTTGIKVVHDFRSADVAAGGQGAPLIPVYHKAMTHTLPWPMAMLNLGGVANITAISADGALTAFDCGMANALIDDWVSRHFGQPYDTDGAIAASGRVDEAALSLMLSHAFFSAPAPKSLDRADFSHAPLAHLAPADGAATLTAFSASGVAKGCALLAEPPRHILVAGGGRHNRTLMAMIAERCRATVEAVDHHGWNGDATEAEGFGYMALRTLRGLPISFPGTTGAPTPIAGGRIVLP